MAAYMTAYVTAYVTEYMTEYVRTLTLPVRPIHLPRMFSIAIALLSMLSYVSRAEPRLELNVSLTNRPEKTQNNH